MTEGTTLGINNDESLYIELYDKDDKWIATPTVRPLNVASLFKTYEAEYFRLQTGKKERRDRKKAYSHANIWKLWGVEFPKCCHCRLTGHNDLADVFVKGMHNEHGTPYQGHLCVTCLGIADVDIHHEKDTKYFKWIESSGLGWS